MSEAVPLRRNRDYALLWSGSAVSALGTQLSAIAYPLLVLSLTHSAVKAGAVASVELVGALLLRLPAGVWVDRWDRRRLMIVSDAVRGAALALGHLTFAHILVVSFIEGCGGVFYRPATTAAIRRIVPATQIRTAVAADQARTRAATLLGPALGGALFGLSRALPFLVDAVTYVYSLLAAVLVGQSLGPDRARDRQRSMRRDLGEGLRFINAHRTIRFVLLVAGATNFLIIGLQLAIIVVATSHGATSTQIGLMLGIGIGIASAGGLVGALVAPKLVELVSPARLLVILTWVGAATIPAMAAWPNVWALGGLLAARMVLTPAANTVLISYQIAHTPDPLQGRVASAGYLVASLGSPLAPVTIGVLLTISATWTFSALTLLAASTAVVMTWKSIHGELPLDALPATTA